MNPDTSSTTAPIGCTVPSEPEQPVGEREAGRIVGLSPHDLKARRLRGNPDRPSHLRYGRAVRYLPSELVRWRASHVVDPTT